MIWKMFKRRQPGTALVPFDNPRSYAGSTPAVDPGAVITRVDLARDKYERRDFKNRRFDDLNAHDAKFIDCDFSYCIFERAYFRGATFQNCKFIGSRFYDCSLRGTSMHLCDFKYATFHRTLLQTREIIAALPLEPNLRRELLQNLRANAAEIGDYSSQRLFVVEEIRSEMDNLWGAATGTSSYYRSKYPTFVDKFMAWAGYVRLRLGGFVWGHGERPFRIVGSAVIMILALSCINFFAVIPRVGWDATDAGFGILRYSFEKLLDADPNPTMKGFVLVDYVLVIMRYVYIGMFISVLFKSVSHR